MFCLKVWKVFPAREIVLQVMIFDLKSDRIVRVNDLLDVFEVVGSLLVGEKGL